MSSTIGLTESEPVELSQRATRRSGRADDGRRARLILLLEAVLLLEAGHSWEQIRDKLDCNGAFIDRWSKRFRRERLAGLFRRYAGRSPSRLTPALEARILDWTLKRKPAFGAVVLAHDGGAGAGKARIEAAAACSLHGFERSGLRAQSGRRHGLYVNPPAHGAVL